MPDSRPLSLTAMLNPLDLSQNVGPKSLGVDRVTRPKGPRSASCHTQATWVRRPFPAPSLLGLEGDVRLKLIIIIIIIINFILQIKSMVLFQYQ